MPPITNTYLRKYGSLIDQISRVQIRKIHPYTLLTNLEIDIPTIQRLLNKEHVIEMAKSIVKDLFPTKNEDELLMEFFSGSPDVLNKIAEIKVLPETASTYKLVSLR